MGEKEDADKKTVPQSITVPIAKIRIRILSNVFNASLAIVLTLREDVIKQIVSKNVISVHQ